MLNFRALLMILDTLLWTVIGIFSILIDFSGRLYMLCASKGWARQIMWISAAKVIVKGGENVDWNRSYIVVSNHQSQLDIPLLFMYLPTPIRFLAKKSLFYIPLFGWSLIITGFIPVDRGSVKRARRSIERASNRVKKGASLVVFAEGTRSSDGSISPFKSGAFLMAIKSGVPILPVAIRGTRHVIPKDKLRVFTGRKVELLIGSPIETDSLSIKDKERLRTDVQENVESMFNASNP